MKAMKKKSPKSWAFLMVIAILLILFGCGHVLYNIYVYHEADQEYADLAGEYIDTGNDTSSEEAEDDVGEMPTLSIDWDVLLAVNPDLYAWLYYRDDYNDVAISLPVVQPSEEDLQKYLHVTFEGTRNSAGCLFIAADADPEQDENVFIYGHNMRNGTMFGQLKNLYQSPDQIRTHVFYLYFPDGSVQTYDLYSVVKTYDGSGLYYSPGTKDTKDYLSQLQESSVYQPEDQFWPSDASDVHLVTLSTCYGRAGTSDRVLVTGMRRSEPLLH